MDSGEAAGSGSAEQAEEYGFGLIVTGVGGGHGIEPMGSGGALEKSVAGAAPGSFQREVQAPGQLCDIFGCEGGVEREAGGERGDEGGVGIRFRAAQGVIEMEDDGHDSQRRGESGKRPQESDGIRTAADGHADALAGTDQAMLAQIAFERLQHGNMIAEAGPGMGWGVMGWGVRRGNIARLVRRRLRKGWDGFARIVNEPQSGNDGLGMAAESLAVAWNRGNMSQEDDFVETRRLKHDDLSRPVPPSYEQCVAESIGPRADYVISPLLMAALFDWDDEQGE